MSDHEIRSAEVYIAAPAAQVWDVLVDLENYQCWNPLNRRVESTLELGAPVTLWITDDDLAQAGAVFVHHVIALEPQRHLAWEYRQTEPVELHTRRDQCLTPLGAAACRYTTTDRFYGAGADALMTAYGASVKASFDALGVALKGRAESLWECAQREIASAGGRA